MDERDCHRAFTDRVGDALDRAVTNVAGDEHARLVRFEQQRVAPERPPRPVASSRSGPVIRKPCSSRLSQPSDALVSGAAPMRMKSASAGRRVSSPVSVSAITSVSSRASPSALATQLLSLTVMLAVASMRSAR